MSLQNREAHTELPNAEQRLFLLILESAPLVVWACDKEGKIRIWNRWAESVYGVSAETAIGQSFFDLFVDEYERDQALSDLAACFECPDPQRNSIGLDNTAKTNRDGSRKKVRVLTNCFRVKCPVTGDWLQAEVAVEIDDIHDRLNDLEAIRRAAEIRAHVAKELSQQELHLQKEKVKSILGSHHARRLQATRSQCDFELTHLQALTTDLSESELAEYKSSIQSKCSNDVASQEKTYNSFVTSITKCNTREELEKEKAAMISLGLVDDFLDWK